MKLEGVTEIHLTDVCTGKIEVVKEKNMVTNALKYIFGQNAAGRMEMNTLKNNLVPMFGKALGGVFAFDAHIEENPEIVVPPGNIACVAHAGNDAYNGTNERRGSFNNIESQLLDDGMKLVWDFTTSQGNGVIRSIGLTSGKGGKNGFGYRLDADSVSIPTVDSFMQYMDYYNSGGTGSEVRPHVKDYKDLEIDDGDFLYSITFSYMYTITITKSLNRKLNISLTNYYGQLKTIASMEKSPGWKQEYVSADIDSQYLYCWTCQAQKTNTIRMYKINKEEFTCEEINIDLPKQIKVLAGAPGIKIMNNYMYILNSEAPYSIMKMNLANFTDVTEIIVPSYGAMFKVAGRIIFNGCVIDANDNVLKYYTRPDGGGPMAEIYSYGICDIWKDLIFTSNGRLFLNMTYLATINNLSAPVQKTADKTMKIIYTVTETA